MILNLMTLASLEEVYMMPNDAIDQVAILDRWHDDDTRMRVGTKAVGPKITFIFTLCSIPAGHHLAIGYGFIDEDYIHRFFQSWNIIVDIIGIHNQGVYICESR